MSNADISEALNRKINALFAEKHYELGQVPVREANDSVFIINNAAAAGFVSGSKKFEPELRGVGVTVTKVSNFRGNLLKEGKLRRQVKGHIRNNYCAVVVQNPAGSPLSRYLPLN